MTGFRIGQRARNFANRSLFEKLWALPVCLGLGLASLMIALLPFRHIAPRLGINCGKTKPVFAVSSSEQTRARQIGRTVRFAASYVSWRADCYPQAIVARLLLGLYRLPYTVSMGVRSDPDSRELQAHAWVECGEVCVTGGNATESYSLVAVFASSDPRK